MTLLDQLDRFLIEFKSINSSTLAVTTLLTLVGAFVVLICLVKTLLAAIEGK